MFEYDNNIKLSKHNHVNIIIKRNWNKLGEFKSLNQANINTNGIPKLFSIMVIYLAYPINVRNVRQQQELIFVRADYFQHCRSNFNY